MDWTDAKLGELPQQNGFRLRGLEMTRLETFADAAFAFALTLLVISVDQIPDSYEGLMLALKGTPAFAASFIAIAAMWYDHRKWSRRYGLEDIGSTLITLSLIFIMLVYVYPLKMVFSAFFAYATGGWLPASFTVSSAAELTNIFIVFGVGMALVMAVFMLLYWRALRATDRLHLNALEVRLTRNEIAMSALLSATAATSTLFAWLTPPDIGVYAGFVYLTLPATMPVLAIWLDRKADAFR